jgi:hypothetical protein
MNLHGEDITDWYPGMAVSLGGGILRVIKVYKGDYLGGEYTELLVVEEDEHATPMWVLPRYVSVLVDECPRRPECAPLSSSSTPSPKPSQSSSGTSSFLRSSTSSTTSGWKCDTASIRTRLRESMAPHPTDAAFHLLTHAERDILDLCDDLDALRETHEVRRS